MEIEVVIASSALGRAACGAVQGAEPNQRLPSSTRDERASASAGHWYTDDDGRTIHHAALLIMLRGLLDARRMIRCSRAVTLIRDDIVGFVA